MRTGMKAAGTNVVKNSTQAACFVISGFGLALLSSSTSTTGCQYAILAAWLSPSSATKPINLGKPLDIGASALAQL